MPRRTVDLASYINQTVERGHPADFPVTLKPLFRSALDSIQKSSGAGAGTELLTMRNRGHDLWIRFRGLGQLLT